MNVVIGQMETLNRSRRKGRGVRPCLLLAFQNTTISASVQQSVQHNDYLIRVKRKSCNERSLVYQPTFNELKSSKISIMMMSIPISKRE